MTLRRRALLRPILELVKRGCTYPWGYPLAVTFRKDMASFTLHTPAELPALFSFLDTDPIQVPNWLLFLPCPTGRSGLSTHRGPPHARPQRFRRRSQAPSVEGSRESRASCHFLFPPLLTTSALVADLPCDQPMGTSYTVHGCPQQ